MAKGREGKAVLSNSRTEPLPQTKPTTPTRQSSSTTSHASSPITPHSDIKPTQRLLSDFQPATSFAEPKHARENEWLHVSDDDLDEDLGKLTDSISMPPPQTPSKAARTTSVTSPGKRRYADLENDDDKYAMTPAASDIFETPNTKFRGRDPTPTASGSATAGPGSLMTPGDTQRTNRTGPPRTADLSSGDDIKRQIDRDASPLGHKSTNIPSSSGSTLASSTPSNADPQVTELSTEILDALRDLHVGLTEQSVKAVKAISHRWSKKLKGTEKARDISRDAYKTRNAKVKELEAEIQRLKGLAGQMAK